MFPTHQEDGNILPPKEYPLVVKYIGGGEAMPKMRMTPSEINRAIDLGHAVVVEWGGARYAATEAYTTWSNRHLVGVEFRADSIPLDECRIYVDGVLKHEPLE